MSDSSLIVEVVQGDVLNFAADVLARTYAQYDAAEPDQPMFDVLLKSIASEANLEPKPGEYVLVD